VGRGIHKLTARKIKTAKEPQRYGDGGGLYFVVTRTGSKQWVFMWTTNGRRREMGLGGHPGVTLAKARQKAQEARELIADGVDPINYRNENVTKTFGQVADELIATLEVKWNKVKDRDIWKKKNKQQWNRSLFHYCSPIRSIPIKELTTQDIVRVLKPIWNTKHETARKTRARMERVFDFAAAHGWHTGDNPAMWKRYVKDILPRSEGKAPKHFEAMPYEDIPDFIKSLHLKDTIPALALEFTILTAARTGETLGANWFEIDFKASVWSIPAERNTKQEHNVPLSGRCMEILATLNDTRTSDFVFPGQRANKPLSNMSMSMILRRMELKATVHGFRSAFRDWCGDQTNFAREVAEAALAHKVGNSVEQAYRRRVALDKRRHLMSNWADYCAGIVQNKIVKLLG